MVRKVNFNDNIQIRYYDIDEIDEIAVENEKINIFNKYIRKVKLYFGHVF
jgi:hypothetical protein